MNRRRFVSLLAATPIGIWASTKLGKAESIPAEAVRADDSYFRLASPESNYDATAKDDLITYEGEKPITITLPPSPQERRNIMIWARHTHLTVKNGNAEWAVEQGRTSMFAAVQGGWYQMTT